MVDQLHPSHHRLRNLPSLKLGNPIGATVVAQNRDLHQEEALLGVAISVGPVSSAVGTGWGFVESPRPRLL